MKVLFDLASGRLTIDGDGPELLKVLEAARTLAPSVKQIQIITSHSPDTDEEADDETRSDEPSTPAAQFGSRKTLRQFARSLSLTNAAERVAAIAYYLNKIEGRQSFSPKDMDGFFTMCGFQKPSQMGLAIFDTKRKYGYVENVSRGAWKLSNQGENCILALIEEGQEKLVALG